MPDAATALADRIEAALARIEAARARTTGRFEALQQVVEASVAELDTMLDAAERR